MADTPDERDDDQPLSERFLDLFVFLPTGVVVTLAEELPRLAERGRERLGVQVNSARAVGRFAVHAGSHELKKRSEGLKRTSSPGTGGTARPAAPPAATGTAAAGQPPRLRSIPRPPTVDSPAPVERPSPGPAAAPPSATTTTTATTPTSAPARPAGGNVPGVASLAIPGFDTLSASQVVQRLDGLGRSELVAVRAYETSTRGRRTILSRVDQLLDERS
jgi:hypothetical protein